VLSWANEPLASSRRFAFDVSIFILLGVAAYLLIDVDWMVIPVLVAGRCVVAGVALLRRETPNDQG
jgi:hypothetical protein